MLQRLLGEDISLHVHYSPNLPGVLADAGMLEQVLLNLAVNSRDAMPRGGQLIINTTVARFASGELGPNLDAYPGEFVCLSVSDTGTGIAPQHLPHIFEPFFHHEGCGQGYRPRSRHGLRDHQTTSRLGHGGQRSGQRNRVPSVSAGECRPIRGRRRAGRRDSSAGGNARPS